MDTLAISKNLQAAGMETRQAVAESIDTKRGDWVTKDYLDSRLEALEARLVARQQSIQSPADRYHRRQRSDYCRDQVFV